MKIDITLGCTNGKHEACKTDWCSCDCHINPSPTTMKECGCHCHHINISKLHFLDCPLHCSPVCEHCQPSEENQFTDVGKMISEEKEWKVEFAPNLGHDPNNPWPLGKPQEEVKVMCASIDCPERTGGKCNAEKGVEGLEKIIGHGDFCEVETGYENDCNCYIKELKSFIRNLLKDERGKVIKD